MPQRRVIFYAVTYIILFNYQMWSCDMLFVPEEVPSLLSFVYNSIPPVAKGTDSRVGLGFRLGPNADFQMMFELGPQKETQTLPPVRGYESRKRHIPMSAYPQRFRTTPTRAAPEPFQVRHAGTPGSWLSAWRTALNARHLSLNNHLEEDDAFDNVNNLSNNNHNNINKPYFFYNNNNNINNNNNNISPNPYYHYSNSNSNRLSYKTIQHLRQLYKEQPEPVR